MSIARTLTTSDASGGTKTSATVRMDWRTNPFQVGIVCTVTGTATYSIQHSNDNVTWTNNANISGATTSQDTNYMFPVEYIRMIQTAGNGSVSATVRQSGPNK